ncbi:UPF0175 family protein [Limnospira sp. PMC 1234.20]|nr:UPF0175 family protein [Limnospira sp. PMC 1234.20]
MINFASISRYISQFRFQQILSERGINIHYDLEELQEDIQHLTAKGWL